MGKIAVNYNSLSSEYNELIAIIENLKDKTNAINSLFMEITNGDVWQGPIRDSFKSTLSTVINESTYKIFNIRSVASYVSLASQYFQSVESNISSSYNVTNADIKTTSQSDSIQSKNNNNYKSKVGSVVANTSSSGYNNSSYYGQCVWYVRGRAAEKLGVKTKPLGNGNEIYYNAKDSAKITADINNIRGDTLACYKVGTSKAGQTAGHVIYIEAVDGDNVYYTECKSGGKAAGTLKVTSKENLMQGIGQNGSRIGTGLEGFVDAKVAYS